MDKLVKLNAYICGYLWLFVHCDGSAIICQRGKVKFIRENGLISIGGRTTFWRDIKLSCVGGPGRIARLKIGWKCSGDRTEIHCGESEEIGDRVIIAWDCNILDRDYHSFRRDGRTHHSRRNRE